MISADTFDPLAIIISREEVEAQDIAPALSTLQYLVSSPEKAKSYQEKVDIAFHGYDDDARGFKHYRNCHIGMHF